MFDNSRRKSIPRQVGIESISSPVGPVTMQGDPTALMSALQSGSPPEQYPFEDLPADRNENRPSSRSSMSTLKAPPHVSIQFEMNDSAGNRDGQESRGSTNTNGSITFIRPLSATSSVTSSNYHPSTGHYDLDPFLDPESPTGTTLLGRRRFSGGSTVMSHSTIRTQHSVRSPIDGLSADGHSFRGPNLTALMNEARGD